MRPTGKLHIGHYFGALENWVRLQNDPTYDCFYFIADWHALTSDYADASDVAHNTIEIEITESALMGDTAYHAIIEKLEAGRLYHRTGRFRIKTARVTTGTFAGISKMEQE